jgi:small GTP-binding protein
MNPSSNTPQPKNYRNDLKIIVVGNSGTGKTSFVNKWTKNTFSDAYKATIVSEFGYKIFEHKGKFYRIQLWDLAGTILIL